MSRKHLDNVLDHYVEDWDHQNHDDLWPADQPDDDYNEYRQLGRWILQMQDGNLKESEFNKLQNTLSKDTDALKYYVEFMQVCAGLHMLFNPQKLDFSIP